jgi:hypothetical protein
LLVRTVGETLGRGFPVVPILVVRGPLASGPIEPDVRFYGREVHCSAGETMVPIRDAEGIGAYVSKIEMEIACQSPQTVETPVGVIL